MSALSQFFGGGGGGTPQPNTIPVRGLVVTGGFGGTCSSFNNCPAPIGIVNYSLEGGCGGLVSYFEEKITPGVTIPITVGAGGSARACAFCLTSPYGPGTRCLLTGGAGGSSCFGSCAYICISSTLCGCDTSPVPGTCGLCYCKLYWKINHNSSLESQYNPKNKFTSPRVLEPISIYCHKAGSLTLRLLPGSINDKCLFVSNLAGCCGRETRPTFLEFRHMTTPSPYGASYTSSMLTFQSGGAMKGFSDSIAAYPSNHLLSPCVSCSDLWGPDTAPANGCAPCYLTNTACGTQGLYGWPSMYDTAFSNQGYQSEITGSIGLYGAAGNGMYGGYCPTYYPCPNVCPTPYGPQIFALHGAINYPVITCCNYPVHQCIGYGSGGPALSTPEGGGPAGGGTVIVQYPTAYSAATTSSPCVLNCSPNTPGCYTYKFICPGSITFP